MGTSDITVTALTTTPGIGHIALKFTTSDPRSGALPNIALNAVEVHGSSTNDRATATKVDEGRDKAFWSTCHGAGRAMSRTQAKKRMGGSQVKAELEEAGVLVNATHPGLLAEEAPYAYKDVARVVDTCEGAGLSRKVARLRPLAVIKG